VIAGDAARGLRLKDDSGRLESDPDTAVEPLVGQREVLKADVEPTPDIDARSHHRAYAGATVVGFDSGDSQVPRSAEVTQFAAALLARPRARVLDPAPALKTLVEFCVDLGVVRSHVRRVCPSLMKYVP
jgi:hypothetical protein